MENYDQLVAGWRQATADYGHAAEALGLPEFPVEDDADAHQVVTVFTLRLAQVLAKCLVDMHIADVNLRGNTGGAEAIAEVVMTLLPDIEAAHHDGKATPVAELLETLLRAAQGRPDRKCEGD